jgi:hypothetical protein
VKRFAIISGVLALLAGLWVWPEPNRNDDPRPSPAGEGRGEEGVRSQSQAGQTNTLIGETILRDYAKASLPPEHDLDLMAQLMDNFLLLVKTAATRPLSANEDWAAELRGRNPAQERFLPDHQAALNADGQLVDRWGTPLFFHALGNGRFEVRSAGPDRKLWTADDIQRNADGLIQKGAELHSADFVDIAMRK